MALNAKFVADFSSLYREIQKAAPYLKDLGDNTDKVARKFDAMTKGFTGENVIREAHLMVAALVQTGNVANLTSQELIKLGKQIDTASEIMRRRGIEIPEGFKHISAEAAIARKRIEEQAEAAKGLGGKYADLTAGALKLAGAFGIAFGAKEIIGGIKQLVAGAAEYSDTLKNMSVQTDISIAGLQRLEAIGAEGGVSMNELAKAVNTLHLRLDDDKAIEAIAKMGLNYKEIRALKPEQQFLELAKAVAAIQDPVEKSNAGAAIFAKTWDTIAPAIVGDMQKVIDSTHLMTDAQVNALADAGQAWENWKREVSRNIDSFLGELVLASKQASGGLLGFLDPSNPLGTGAAIARSYFDPGKITYPGGPNLAAGAGTTAPIESAMKDLNAQIDKQQAAAQKVREQTEKILKDSLGITSAWERGVAETKLFLQNITTLESRFYGGGLTKGPADLLNFVQGTQYKPNTGSGNFSGIGTGPAPIGNKTFTTDRGSIFSGLTTSAPQAIVSALQGGGNVAQSVASTVGTQLASNVVGKFGTSIVNTLGKTFGGAINAVLPGLGALAGPLIGLVGKLFGKSEESSKVSPLRDEFFKMQGGLETLNPKVQQLTGNLSQVDAIFKAKTADQYNAALKALNETLAAPEQALQVLTETAQRYGFTLEELGPALQRQDLDKQAQQLYKDFQVLNQGGLEHEAILTRMAENANAYVNQALKLGVEVPQAMKPFLEELASSGKLLDENGNQITDLEKAGISFSLTMSEGFKKMIESVDKLTRAIAVGLGVAIKDIPDPDITGRVHWDVDDLPKPDGWNVDGASTGGIVTRNGIQHFAMGGKVLPFRPRGSDTVPAMLTPGEMVLTAAQQRSLLAGGRSGGDIHIHVEAEGRELARAVVPYLPRAVGDVL